MKLDQQIHYWAHMLDEAFDKEQLLTEGKHWPEDYVKTAYNTIKNSQLGKQSWYTDEYLIRDLIGPPINPNASIQQPLHDINHIDKSDLAHNANQYGILGDFSPLMHKNSNLGFFATVIRWFIEYSGTSADKYQEFIERKLDKIIAGLLKIRADKEYDARTEEIKKMSFDQFMKLVDEVNSKTSNDVDIAVSDAEYEVIPIYSYEELHEKYGGDKTGWNGESEWCHTNGKSTYESWTRDGTQMFFIVQRKDWQDIKAPAQKSDSCYDEYGMSLIAILVDVMTNKLLNSTSRWNHVVLPKSGSADIMFESWEQLNKAVGIDVKNACKNINAQFKQKAKNANAIVEKILSQVNAIDEYTISLEYKKYITKIDIPDNVTRIENDAFRNYICLTNVTIPNSVIHIGSSAFAESKLTSIIIPDSVTSIKSSTFYGCIDLINAIIPDSVTSIGVCTFQDCYNLTNVSIGNNVTSIGASAFEECHNLTSLKLPNSVMNIGSYAFDGCFRLTNIEFQGKTLSQVQSMQNYPWGIEDESIIKCDDTLTENISKSFQKYEDKNNMTESTDILECISIDITDEMLQNAKIAAYMSNQVIKNPYGKMKPYNPKSFPDKAIVIQFENNGIEFQIYLDSKDKTWNSFFIQDGHVAKLAPEQLDAFFSTQFYANLVNSLSKKWPTKDPTYAELWQAVMDCDCSTEIKDDELERTQFLDEVDQPGKRRDLANKDVDNDNKRDYAGSGRKIIHFSDLGVSNKSGEYYCWPRPGKEFKWNSWKEWKKQKPFAKMYFKHNGRKYMISLSLFDENFDHRGFRGADVDWTPPFAWVTPGECDEIMKLSIVRKFLKQCLKKVKPYMDMTPEEVYQKIDKPERVDIKEIEKTLRVIRHVMKTAFKDQQADDYKYD